MYLTLGLQRRGQVGSARLSCPFVAGHGPTPYRDPSMAIILTLGPKMHEHYLLWANWIFRECCDLLLAISGTAQEQANIATTFKKKRPAGHTSAGLRSC